jgi:transposase
LPTFSEEKPDAPKEVSDAPYQRSGPSDGTSHSQREISSSVGMSRTTVRNYPARAKHAGLKCPLPAHLDEAVIEARLFKRTDAGVRSNRPEADWLEVHHQHKRGKHVTLQLLHLEYKLAHPDGWGYTRFCRHYRRWLGRQDVVMRLEYAAGERMFVDLAGDTVRSGWTPCLSATADPTPRRSRCSRWRRIRTSN